MQMPLKLVCNRYSVAFTNQFFRLNFYTRKMEDPNKNIKDCTDCTDNADNTDSITCTHEWVKNHTFYVCNACGDTSTKKPHDYTSEIEEGEDDEPGGEGDAEKCKHVWECLKDRCHNRGKGKYQAYKCKLCRKFQRR